SAGPGGRLAQPSWADRLGYLLLESDDRRLRPGQDLLALRAVPYRCRRRGSRPVAGRLFADGRQFPAGEARYRHQRVLHGYLSRSEEHTSELQSRENLVCRLLLENKK